MNLNKIIQRAKQATDSAIAALHGLTHGNPEVKMQLEQLKTSSAQLAEAAAELPNVEEPRITGHSDEELHPENHAPRSGDTPDTVEEEEKIWKEATAAATPVVEESHPNPDVPTPAGKSPRGPGPDEKGHKGARGVKGVKLKVRPGFPEFGKPG